MTRKLDGSLIQSGTITTTQLSSAVANSISAGGGPRVTSLIYPGNDTAANTVGGQTVYVNGSGFASNAAVYINGSAVPSIAFISASNLQITTPALSSATYPVYVINPETGATAILIPGLIVSGEPTWVTAAGSLSASQDETSAWSYSLSATGDAPITYALAAGNTLPSGISLASNGAISGTLSSPAGNTTTYTFSVVASDAQNQDSTRQFTVTTSVGEGVVFANNVLLIHADGTNNGNNHAFLDSSNNNYTITRAGNATQGSFSPFSQTGWSNYFDGTGDYLSVGDQTAFEFGSGDYTVELWWYPTSSSDQNIIGKWDAGGSEWILQWRSAGYYRWASGGSVVSDATTTLVLNRWNHVAVTKTGTSLKIYTNGSQIGTTATESSISATGAALTIGAAQLNSSPAYVPGYISNLRILKGTAQYTGSTYTVPTSALTAIANTSLLTCQSNRFIDNSTNAFTITRNGDTSIQAFSPFAPSATYSAANVGGSVYLDGTGDYLSTPTTPANFGANNFTIETWVWFNTNSAGYQPVLTNSGSGDYQGWVMITETNNILWFITTTNGSSWTHSINTGITPTTNCWTHLAVVRNGSTITYYVNGVATGTSNIGASSLHAPSNAYYTGYYPYFPGGARAFNGYFSGTRLINGTALYTSNFTPPTAPPTNVANTSLLLNYTNAQIFDQTAKTVLETVGDAKVSTSVYKYGTGSIAFDGTGDRLYTDIRYNKQYNFGVGGVPFTVECWVYFNSVTGCIGARGGGFGGWNSTSGHLINLGSYSAGNWYLQWWNGSSIVSNGVSNPFSSGQWYHYAVSYDGSTIKAYKDGVAFITVSNPTIAAPSASYYFTIGDLPSVDGPLNGYIDDFRITNGSARYTSNFTPPTSAMKDR